MELKNLLGKIKDKKVIFLDLDNTLYPFAPCHQQGLKSAFSVYRKFFPRTTFRSFHAAYRHAQKRVKAHTRRQAASHSRLLYFQSLIEEKSRKTDCPKALVLEKAYWDGFFSKMKLFGWVIPFLKKCRASNKKVMLITNLTAQIQFRKISKLRLKKFVDWITSSEEAGVEKPARRIFELALKKARCRPSEVLLIGDDPNQDTCGLFSSVLITKRRTH